MTSNLVQLYNGTSLVSAYPVPNELVGTWNGYSLGDESLPYGLFYGMTAEANGQNAWLVGDDSKYVQTTDAFFCDGYGMGRWIAADGESLFCNTFKREGNFLRSLGTAITNIQECKPQDLSNVDPAFGVAYMYLVNATDAPVDTSSWTCNRPDSDVQP